MTRKRFVQSGIVVSVLIVLGLFLISSSTYTNLISQRIIKASQDRGVSLQIQNSTRKGLGIDFQGVSTLIPLNRFYLMLAADNLWIRPHYLSLLSSNPGYSIQSNAYGGEFSVSGFNNWDGASGTVDVDIKDVNIALHSQVEGFGIRSGLLSVRADDVQWDKGQLKQVTAASVNLRDFSIPDPIEIPAGSFDLPMEIRIPALQEGQLSGIIDVQDSEISISDLIFSSTWGRLKGSVTFSVVRSGLAPNAVSLDIALNDQSREYFGPVFQLLSGGKVTEHTKDIKVRGNGGAHNIKVLPG